MKSPCSLLRDKGMPLLLQWHLLLGGEGGGVIIIRGLIPVSGIGY